MHLSVFLFWTPEKASRRQCLGGGMAFQVFVFSLVLGIVSQQMGAALCGLVYLRLV